MKDFPCFNFFLIDSTFYWYCAYNAMFVVLYFQNMIFKTFYLGSDYFDFDGILPLDTILL